jgi:small subunit ribosomal protein S2
MATVISMKALLESGVHFGHRTNKWNPHMRPYIFTERNGIHIIDLQQTVKAINTAYGVVRDAVSKGGTILFIGTKRQAQETIKDEATRCGMPYVTERWLGGMITNWVTINQRISELEELERLRDSGEINRLTKKEGLLINREINRLLIRLSGVRNMKRTPDLIFVVDVGREETAVHEANLKEIPVIAMMDTNCDPRNIDYVIPSNDDAIRAIKLLVGKIADAVLEGKAMRKEEEQEDTDIAGEAGSAIRRAGVRPRMDEDSELEDKDLLGASTLAKIARSDEEDGGDKEPEVTEPKVTEPKATESKETETEEIETEEAEVKETEAKETEAKETKTKETKTKDTKTKETEAKETEAEETEAEETEAEETEAKENDAEA